MYIHFIPRQTSRADLKTYQCMPLGGNVLFAHGEESEQQLMNKTQITFSEYCIVKINY